MIDASGKNGLIDIRPLVREYITSMGVIQNKVRAELKDDVLAAENNILEEIKFYEKEGDGSTLGLAAVELDSNGKYINFSELFEEPIKYRKSLVERYKGTTPLTSCYVSSEV